MVRRPGCGDTSIRCGSNASPWPEKGCRVKHRRKSCKQCGVEKTIAQFYRHPHYADGHENICKLCKRDNVRENVELKFEYYQAKKRERSARPENVAKRAAYNRSERGRQVKRECYARAKRFRELIAQQAAA